MNHKVVSKELVRRFGNAGAKAIHGWMRQQYGRIVSKADGHTSLDNVTTQGVFKEIERHLNCFTNIKPSEFVRWFKMVPAFDSFGRTQASVDVLPELYQDALLSANPELKFDSVVLRGDDLIDAPSTTQRMLYQVSTNNYHSEIRGAAISVTDGKRAATLVIPENEVKQIIEVHKRTKYRCDPLDSTEWNSVLIAVCFRRFMSFSEAGHWVRNVDPSVLHSLDMLDSELHAIYKQHTFTQDVKDNFTGRLVASVVQAHDFEEDTLKSLNDSANEVRKRLNLPAEGCDASVLALEQDFLATKAQGSKKAVTPVQSANVVSFGAFERDIKDADDFSDTEWGSF